MEGSDALIGPEDIAYGLDLTPAHADSEDDAALSRDLAAGDKEIARGVVLLQERHVRGHVGVNLLEIHFVGQFDDEHGAFAGLAVRSDGAAMLADDAKITMPPLPGWYSGRDQIAAFLRLYPLSETHRWRMLPTSANGQPALAGYLWDGDADAFVPNCLSVLTLRDNEIAEVTAFLTPEAFLRFDLPASVAP